MSSSSSSSFLYMIALLLVLIHSSIQSGFPNDVFTSLSKQISEVQDHMEHYVKRLVNSYSQLERTTNILKNGYPEEKETIEPYVSCLKRNRSETFPKYFFRGMDKLEQEIRKHYQNYSEKALEKLKQCTASLKQYFIKLQSEGERMTCDLPNSISAGNRNSLYSQIQIQRHDISIINILAMINLHT
ncbi:hypothetical protein KSF78_0004641 [Schistosoma japonicum]|nr:hypothetical protein KSF78_0004641 [Schistosoma japonicum]